jgi:GMP synthase (glutamine-hydrolysing)
MSINPKILVVDGYVKAARDELVAGGAKKAGDQYVQMLIKINPNVHCDIIYLSDPGIVIPSGIALSDYDGVAWTGCSLTVFDDTPEVNTQINFARACFDAGLPGFGSCWAAQIAVVAAGGTCRTNPNGREMGFARKIALTDAGRGHAMYEGKSSVFDAYISHVDEITHIPAGSVVLSGNTFTSIQSVSVLYKGTPFWGLQTLSTMRSLAAQNCLFCTCLFHALLILRTMRSVSSSDLLQSGPLQRTCSCLPLHMESRN